MRDWLLRACVLAGSAAAVLTELLGVFHLLRPFPVAIAWLLIAAAALLYLRRHPLPLHRIALRPLETAIACAIAWIAAMAAVAAWIEPAQQPRRSRLSSPARALLGAIRQRRRLPHALR